MKDCSNAFAPSRAMKASQNNGADLHLPPHGWQQYLGVQYLDCGLESEKYGNSL
jgi:hypothetical protein